MFVASTNTLRLESDAGGEHIDPRNDELLATSDAQPAGRYLTTITIAAVGVNSSFAKFEIQRRNSADDDVLESAIVVVPADDTRQFDFAFALDLNERISVYPTADMVGIVNVAINWQRIS